MSQTEDSRRQLYNRFYETVGRPNANIFLDEDDVIDIYDYANDINDDFIKLEALFYGARMFPDSEALKIRRDYLYYYLGNDKAVKVMLERRNVHSTLSRLLALREKTDSNQSTIDDLARILDDCTGFDDEEVIQFVSEAGAKENYLWLKGHIDAIKKKCAYLPTLYYELANVAEDNGDYLFARKMAEELTMLEPFEIDYWERLAELEYHADDLDACLNSLEYALAIDPQSQKSLLFKAMALFNKDNASQEAAAILTQLKESGNIDSVAIQTLAIIMTNLGDRAKAIDMLVEHLPENPGDRVLLDTLLLLDTENATRYEPFLKSEEFVDTESFWADWTLRYMTRANAKAAVMVAREGYLRTGFTAYRPLYLEALYAAGLYNDVVDTLQQWINAKETLTAEVVVIGVMALIRLGRRQEALEDATLYVDYLKSYNLQPIPATACENGDAPTYTFRGLYTIGVRAALTNIISALNSPEEIPIDDFDPIRLPQSPDAT